MTSKVHEKSRSENVFALNQGYRDLVQGPVVQSVVSLTSSLRVISLTVLADSIYNFLKCFAEKNVSSFCKSYSHFFSKKFQHICVSLDTNFNESLTNIVSFEQLGPGILTRVLESQIRSENSALIVRLLCTSFEQEK